MTYVDEPAIEEYLDPLMVIIISSAKCRSELPFRYRFMKLIPLYQIVPARLYIPLGHLARAVFESDYKREEEVFRAMLNAKDPQFVKRAIRLTVRWQHTECSDRIVHIHGTRDHTLPLRNIADPIAIEGGSHMMALTESEAISGLINQLLDKYR